MHTCLWLWQSCVVKGFQYAKEYASKFEPLMEFFSANETLDLQELADKDHGRLPIHHPLSCLASLPLLVVM